MDLFSIMGACLRRWYVTLPVLALTGWFAVQAYEAVPSEYTSTVSVVVLPSNVVQEEVEGAPPQPDNPYSGSGGPRFAAAVLARNINTEAYRERIGLGDAEGVTFEASASQQQPIIRIDAVAPTPEEVLTTLDAVVAQADEVLVEFQTQAGAVAPDLFRLAPAVPADRVEDVTPSRFRTAGAIAVLGGLVAAGLAAGVDALARLRRDRRGDDGTADGLTDLDDEPAVLRVDRAEGGRTRGARSGSDVERPEREVVRRR